MKFLQGLSSVAITALASLSLWGPQDQQDKYEPERPFRHSSHVNKVWAKGDAADMPEVERDCRGCHAFKSDAPEPEFEPQATCAWCHYRGNWQPNHQASTLEALREEVAMGGFVHGEHASLACRACHRPDSEKVRYRMWIPKGSGVCFECHRDSATEAPPAHGAKDFLMGRSAASDAVPLNEAFASGINGSPEMAAASLGPFLHEDHPVDLLGVAPLEVSRVAEEQSCGVCHQHAFRWAAQGTAPGSPGAPPEFDGCAQCHMQAGSGAGSEPGTVPIEIEFNDSDAARAAVVSSTLGTFDHADHLRQGLGEKAAATEAGSQAVQSAGCGACHSYSESTHNFTVAGALLEGTRSTVDPTTYEGCQVCHDVSGWRAPIHADWSRAATQASAGVAGSPGSCTVCHAFGVEKNLDETLREESVERRQPVRFEITSQAHPFVSTGGASGAVRAEECAACHRAPVGKLPSRIGLSAFRHSTHLGENADAADCRACHSAMIDATRSSWEIGRFKAGVRLDPAGPDKDQLGLTYDIDACAKCHLGAPLVPRFGPASESSTVRSFPHDLHLAPGIELDCISCHNPGGGRVDEIGVIETANNCSQCHGHDVQETPEGSLERWKVTGWLRRAEADSCGACHDAGAGFVPLENTAFEVALAQNAQRATPPVADGDQFHPTDKDCTECHRAAGWSTWEEGRVFTGDDGYAGVEKFKIHSSEWDDGTDPSPQECLDCHWGRIQTSGWPNDYAKPEDAKTRRDRGNQMSLTTSVPYPGYRKR